MKVAANKLGIYVQVPFCQTKCTYCNFHTGVVSSARFAPYVNCVCAEIAGHRGLYEAAGITTAIALAVAAGGAIKSSKTTALMTGAQGMEALKKAGVVAKTYRPAK